MREIKYADAGMDMKKLMLRFIGKIWLVLLAAIVGAAIGGVAYTVSHIVPASEREYRAMAKIYLDFAVDETGEVYQAYNGYTWNDLMRTNPILDKTMAHLPGDYTRDEVMAATEAEILSDIRLLTIYITAHDQTRCDAILSSTGQALAELGDTAKEFKQIEVIQTTEAAPVVADARTVQAVLVGIVTAVVLLLLGMMLYYILDDRIVVASDWKIVTDASFIGYTGAGERLDKEYQDHLAYLQEKTGSICVLTIAQDDIITQDKWQELCASDGVVVVADYGKVHAAFLSYMIEQLQVRGCRLIGVAIGGADEKFLRRYYGRAFGGR